MNLISKLACSVGHVLALYLCGAVVLASAAAAADKPRPNIVVLVADDWGFSDVGAYGSEIETPNIDELARHGVRFSNFHVAASCAPTRSMLLTGVDNHLNGVGNLRETMPQEHLGKPGYLGSLDTNVVTVATLLQDSGYRTYIAGKWNVGSEPYNLPNRRGFDRSIVQGDTGSDNWVPSQRYLPHSARVNWFEDGKQPVMPAEFYSSQYFVDRVIGYIDSGARSGKPFFAYVGFQANHVPLQAPRAFIDKYQGRYDAGWTVLRNARRDKAAALGLIPADTPMLSMKTTGNWDALSEKDKRYEARRMEVYAAMADAMDYHLGRLVAHLKATGEYDNTVFVFLSDNGPEGSDYADARLWLMTQYTQEIDKLGARGAFSIMGPSWASAAAAPLNMYKFYAGEGGIRVPLIIAGVPGMAQNRIEGSLAHVTDIVPTLLDLARVAHPGTHYNGRPIEALTGRSLLPVLTGQAERVHDAGETIGYELSGNQALFKGDLKLVKDSPPLGDGLWHLYDLRTDPGETQDLQVRLPEVFKAMQVDYEAYARSHRVLSMPPGYSPVRQVVINSFVNYWIPTYRDTVLASLAGLLALGVAIVMLRRRRS
jgi:arylsulfatase A-like enzyme